MDNKFGPDCIGNVIRIISNTELIIDVGEYDLTEGDKVQIYEVGEEIFDLNGNSLGLYEKKKATLEVINTTANYSICAKIITKTSSGLFTTLDPFRPVERTEKIPLNVDEKDIKPLNLNDDLTIHIGDPVKKC